MSVKDPLLKEFKGYAFNLLQNGNSTINDNEENLFPFCMCLETIFESGLQYHMNSFVFNKRQNSWLWLEDLISQPISVPFNFLSSINAVKDSEKATTPLGKLRLLIRTCLVKKCLHVPVELLVRHHLFQGVYSSSSILGDEILAEILLSTLLLFRHLTFELDLSNCSFLDYTWLLPCCVNLEFVPCRVLGLTLNFINGKALVMNVQEHTVAEENGAIMVGDILDELNGVPVTAATRNKLSSMMKKGTGKPVTVKIIKALYEDSEAIYPPILNMLLQAHIVPNDLIRLRLLKSKTYSSQETSQDFSRAGLEVTSIGSIDIGNKGDVKQITPAISKIIRQKSETKSVLIEILEIGIRLVDKESGDVLANPSYMEISSCGLSSHHPNYFAYIAGEKTCSTAKSFTCFVFHSTNEEQVQTILRCIGQGFQRTNFAV